MQRRLRKPLVKNHVTPSPPFSNCMSRFIYRPGFMSSLGRKPSRLRPPGVCSLRRGIPCCPGRPAGPAGPGNEEEKGKKRLCHISRVPVLERAEDKVGPGYTPSFLTRHGTVTQRGQLALGPWDGQDHPLRHCSSTTRDFHAPQCPLPHGAYQEGRLVHTCTGHVKSCVSFTCEHF